MESTLAPPLAWRCLWVYSGGFVLSTESCDIYPVSGRFARTPIQSYQSEISSPVVADSGNIFDAGVQRSCIPGARLEIEVHVRQQVDLVDDDQPAAANMCGYFNGLSAPSVTEITTTLLCSPRSNMAGQTRLPTFSMNSSEPGSGSSVSRARRTMSASRWQPAPRC